MTPSVEPSTKRSKNVSIKKFELNKKSFKTEKKVFELEVKVLPVWESLVFTEKQARGYPTQL